MANLVAGVNGQITTGQLAAAVPNVAGVLAVIVLFSLGIYLVKRVMNGASKGRAKI